MLCARISLVCAVVIGYVYGNDGDFRRIDAIHVEAPCSRMGGMCTVAADCPNGQLAGHGLCPDQRDQGVECCHGISMKETRCAKHGGVCISLSENYCNPRLVYDTASDCPDNRRCCIMV